MFVLNETNVFRVCCTPVDMRQGILRQSHLVRSNDFNLSDGVVYVFYNRSRNRISSPFRGKAKATVEFGAKIDASIVSGYTYADHVSWDAYNESSDLGMQLELYKRRFGMLPKKIQADKLYLGKENRKHIKSCHVNCYNRPMGRPPKEENDTHAEDKKRAIGERNEIEGTFGTTKRVYRADDIRAKLDQTADTWIGACFFAKNIMKFLRGLLCLIFEKSGLKTFQKRIMSIFDCMEAVLPTLQGCMKEIY